MEYTTEKSIKVNNTRCSGSLFHFPHFMMDCLFNEIRHEIYKYDIVYRRKTLAQSLGIFSKIYEEVMEIKSIEIPDQHFEDLSLNLIITPRPNHPTKPEIDKFRQFIFERYQYDPTSQDDGFPEVILIERGERIELMIDDELKKKNTNVTTGKERREINDIELLKEFLENKYGDKFKALIFETMEFRDQIKYFKNAKIVIGVHGGGLANILFCKPNTALIEISGGGDFGWHFLNDSCKLLEVKQIKCENELIKIKTAIENIFTKKTVILAWTHKVSNLVTTTKDNFWGLGDTIRGTIELFQLSKIMGFNLVVDTQLHNVSKYLKTQAHEYSDYVVENRDNIPFIQNAEQYIFNSPDNILIFATNGNQRFREPISEECKQFIKELLCPNEDFERYINSKISGIAYPDNYSILHYRLNDCEMINVDDSTVNYERYLENLKQHIQPSSVLLSTSKKFKEYIKSHVDAFMFDIDIGHMGYLQHKDIIKDTLFEFFVLTRANSIKTYSVYRWSSGFARIANEIYDVPLQRI